MELLIFKFKSGIKIKPSHKGLFTDYCGGKVTSACIAKGKRSPNAAIRKRATFAANARKWKHLKGGLLTSVYDYELPIKKVYVPKISDKSTEDEDYFPSPVLDKTFYSSSKDKKDDSLKFNFILPDGSVAEEISTANDETNLDDLNKSLSEILTEEGIEHTVTSSYRPGATTSKGRASNHSKKDSNGLPMAYDIAPKDGDFDNFRRLIYGNSRVMNWLRNKHWGILEEIDPRRGYIDLNGNFKYTGATGPHFHFGPDGFLKE